MNSPYRTNKQVIAQSFSQAAAGYNAVADLQRRIGHRLIELLPKAEYQRVLDLGCGTGYFASRLEREVKAEQLIGVDMAQGMVAFAKGSTTLARADWCCADAEALPLKDASQSMIFSNLALQWCGDLAKVMAEAMRVLRPGGCFAFSTLGPGTLSELKAAWQQVDDYVHVNHFLNGQEIQLAVAAAGFDAEMTDERIVISYHQLRELTAELKSLGAHNMNVGRRTGLTGKRSLEKLRQAYELYRDAQGMLPATYQAYYFVLHKNANLSS